jgi:DNA repair protein SbcC/Rad50
MIKVHRIEIDNIRSLGHAVFEPLVDGGMTAVNGPNGAGKSSILHAMVWALFGVTPDGVPQSAMRRQGTDGTCRVIVEFEYDTQVITVERGLKGRKDTPYLIIHTNGVEQAKGGTRAGQAWIVNTLGGLDSEGFMTAFVIRQKELDGLVKAKPAQRRALIERLAGIDRMSAALKSAREEETEVKKRLELLPGNPEAAHAARKALDDAEQRAIALWETYEAATTAAETAAEEARHAQDAAQAMQARVEEHLAAERALSTATHNLNLATERAQGTRNELSRATAAAEGGTPDEVAAAHAAHNDALSTLQTNKQAREAADRAVQAARDAANRASEATDRARRARTAATTATNDANDANARLASIPADLPEQLAQVESDLAETTRRVGSMRGEHERLTASIKAMEATPEGNTCCPTCATTLADPTQVLASLHEAKDRVANEGRTAQSAVADLETKTRTLREQQERAIQVRNAAHHLAERAATATATAEEADADATQATHTTETLSQVAEDAKASAMSAAQQTTTLEQAVTAAAEHLRAAQVAAAAAARLPELTQARDNAEQEVTGATRTHTEATAREAGTRVDPAEKSSVLDRDILARNNAAATENAKVQAHGNFRVAEEQVNSAERVRDAEELRMRARAETYELLEQKTAVKEALDAFRKERIASLAPELSEIATDQIARMTDGKFIAIELDEEFTPVVTDSEGIQRPALWLSGGEESAVALALRLAIGEVIAGQQGGLLWMDEPQTAMDATRRPAMMSVVRALPGRQTIIISHVSEATDMVDLVVEVVPNTDSGSTLANAGDPAAEDAYNLSAIA